MALVRRFETVPGALADKSGESPTLEEVEAQLTRSFWALILLSRKHSRISLRIPS